MAITKNIPFGDGDTEKDGVNAHVPKRLASTEGVKTNKTMDKELKRLGLTKKDFKDMKLPDPNPFRTKV